MDFDVASDESVSMAVVRAVSTASQTDACSLPPIANSLDPDALDALFEPTSDGSARSGARISFVYGGYDVTVDNGEYITVRRDDPPSGADADTDCSAGA